MFKKIENFLNIFTPPQPISWQTLISLSLFSWGFAIFAYSLPNQSAIVTARFSNNLAFIFFIIGLFWLQTEKRWKLLGIQLRPILVGLLISIFLFKGFPNAFFLILKSWPILSGLLSIIPDFFESFKPILPPPEKRYILMITLLIYLLITCWVYFYFFLQAWLISDAENSYFNKNLDQSIFVVRLIPQKMETMVQNATEYNIPEEGKKVIQNLEKFIENNIENTSWENIEYLVKNIESERFQNNLNKFLKNQIKDSSWSIKVEVIPQKKENQSNISEYNLNLWLIWTGSNADPVAIKKTCQLKQNAVSITDPTAKVFAELTCQNPTITGDVTIP